MATNLNTTKAYLDELIAKIGESLDAELDQEQKNIFINYLKNIQADAFPATILADVIKFEFKLFELLESQIIKIDTEQKLEQFQAVVAAISDVLDSVIELDMVASPPKKSSTPGIFSKSPSSSDLLKREKIEHGKIIKDIAKYAGVVEIKALAGQARKLQRVREKHQSNLKKKYYENIRARDKVKKDVADIINNKFKMNNYKSATEYYNAVYLDLTADDSKIKSALNAYGYMIDNISLDGNTKVFKIVKDCEPVAVLKLSLLAKVDLEVNQIALEACKKSRAVCGTENMFIHEADEASHESDYSCLYVGDYFPNGSLENLRNKEIGDAANISKVCTFANNYSLKIIDTLESLQRAGVVMLDVKPGNFLIDVSGNLHSDDFKSFRPETTIDDRRVVVNSELYAATYKDIAAFTTPGYFVESDFSELSREFEIEAYQSANLAANLYWLLVGEVPEKNQEFDFDRGIFMGEQGRFYQHLIESLSNPDLAKRIAIQEAKQKILDHCHQPDVVYDDISSPGF